MLLDKNRTLKTTGAAPVKQNPRPTRNNGVWGTLRMATRKNYDFLLARIAQARAGNSIVSWGLVGSAALSRSRIAAWIC